MATSRVRTIRGKNLIGWKRPFEEPIPLPRGRLVTLEDAGDYITKLPKAEHTAPEWQAAMEGLMLVATLGGPTMFARIGVMRALNRRVERVFNHRCTWSGTCEIATLREVGETFRNVRPHKLPSSRSNKAALPKGPW
jgi:hypothetical protein